MIFVSAQPADIFFLWQLEVQLYNFRRLGIPAHCIHVLLGIDRRKGLPVAFRKFVCREDLARFFVYPDEREEARYDPGIRPHILRQHFECFPHLAEVAIFYHDCDILFRELPDWGEMETDANWYVSDTRNYLDSVYIRRHGETVLDEMCGIVGIDKAMVIAADADAGGAQYVLKGVDAGFWAKVESDSERLFSHLDSRREEYARRYALENGGAPGAGGDSPVYKTIQCWCADMWAVFWNGLLRGHAVRISRKLDFCWPKDPLQRWEDCYLFHNAGIGSRQRRKYFYKAAYADRLPYFDDLSKLSRDTCSAFYVDELQNSSRGLRYDLKDTTILIPVRIDSADRLDNLRTVLRFLHTRFDMPMVVLEAGACRRVEPDMLPPGVDYVFEADDRPFFYHTLYNNRLLRRCRTPYAAIYDADVIIAPDQLLSAVEYLRGGDASLVYPYDGSFYFVGASHSRWFRQRLDIGVLYRWSEYAQKLPVESHGGVCVLNVDVYRRLGLDNINLVGWGPEDRERCKRFAIAGESVKRVEGVLFHLDHVRNPASWAYSEKIELLNKAEYLRVCNMRKPDLLAHIREWQEPGYRAPALANIE